MAMPSLDPQHLGLSAEELCYEAPDGRYGITLSHHAGSIYLVHEHGYADDAAGQGLVALFVRLLDAVEHHAPGAQLYLCSDYSDYRGSSNATRKAMLRDVVMHPSLGAVAFFGAGFVTRSVAMLLNVALPRLAARPFRTQADALAFLEQFAGHGEPADVRPPIVVVPDPSLDAAVLATFLLRNDDASRDVELAGEIRRVVRPKGWRWCSSAGGASVQVALVDDDLLLVEPKGAFDARLNDACASLVERALDDLGVHMVALLLDLRDAGPVDASSWGPCIRTLRHRRDRLLHVVVVGELVHVSAIDPLLVLGSDVLPGRPVFTEIDRAFEVLDAARQSRLEAAAELVLPESRAELESFTRSLHRTLTGHRKALERLFAFVGRVSWDESYLADSLAIPEDVTASDPYWSVYGSLHLMQQDMIEVLRDREARNRELVEARAQAEAANSAKSAFLGTVSHELRTPLNAIFGMSDLLRDSGLRGDQLRQLDGIEAASRQLSRLVGDLLDMTRIEEGVFTLNEEHFELGALLDELAGGWAVAARRAGLDFELKLRSGVPAGVLTDRGRLAQVLGNLVDNAIKFTEQGSVLVVVAPVQGGVAFEVTDSGRGIAAEDLPYVFERFERGETGRTDVLPGVGLGLSICQQLVGLMGGEIVVSSVVGQGTCFRFVLPLLQDAAVPRPAATPPPTSAPPADFSDLLVLLAEDDAPSRYVGQRLLESLGCQVVLAVDGREALDRLERGRFDLVLMDCQMPFLDGMEVTRRFRAAEPEDRHTPIIAVTAYAFDEDRERTRAAGMDDHQAKPISRERFVALLQRYCC